jgi:diaminohydroxyphosphoribosylaminopyrimidine deaminase/5-amino-6-(5-phosphoribosylamino)uracil reductase
MSTKKDKFTQKDSYFMNLAFNLARERSGLTGKNPPVGCVIVKNDEVISLGQTGLNGRPHAEYNAIKSCKESLKGSTIYVSLEPCAHYGKTPPCTNLIIKSKIKKVIFSIIDVDKRTKSKSFKIFRSKNVQVKCGLLKKEGNIIYKPYIFNKSKELPFVTGKLAVSKDNFIFSKQKSRITNKYSDKITQLLRYKNDSILISVKTLNIDNPKLTCRIEGLSMYSPKKIILDRCLSIKKNSYIFANSSNKDTIIFYNRGTQKKINLLKKKGIKLIKFALSKDNLFDLKNILRKIFSLGCRNLLVESGKNLTNSFLKNNLFNKFYLLQSPIKLGTSGKLNVSSQLHQLAFKYKNKSKINSFTGNDVINIYSK